MSDLDTVPTQELVQTLTARFEHAAFIGIQPKYDGKDNARFVESWRGNDFVVLGLLAELSHTILTQAKPATVTEPEEQKP